MQSAPILIALGSNQQAQSHLSQAQKILKGMFPDISFSRAMRTKAIGDIYHADFINCVALAHSVRDAEHIIRELKSLEALCGDDKDARKRGEVRLDADLLLCQGQIYHPSDWRRAYVRLLLNELRDTAPQEVSDFILSQYQQ